MKILWSIHLYPPLHNAGAEAVCHDFNKWLLKRGHEVRVVLHQGPRHKIYSTYNWEGVEVFPPVKNIHDQYRWADIVMTHLDYTSLSIQICQAVNRKLVHWKHNDIFYDVIHASQKSMNSIVFNSRWIQEKEDYGIPSAVMHPPCDPEFYDLKKDPYNNEYITLINLNENKGGKIFSRIAQAMPDKKFLGVLGSYERQYFENLPNLTILDNSPNIKNVYNQTRISLVISRYESWGRVATESMCNGIPVICTPTPGLKENCDYAGIYVPKRGGLLKDGQYDFVIKDDEFDYDIRPIIKQIKKLDNRNHYKSVSDLCRKRSRELDPQKEMEEIEQFMYSQLYSYARA